MIHITLKPRHPQISSHDKSVISIIFSATSPFIIFSEAYFADYPKFLAATILMADELGEDHIWSDISFREAAEEDKERIKSALDSEGSFPER